METIRTFWTKKNGHVFEDEVKLTYEAMDKAEFLEAAKASRWLETVGAETVVGVRRVTVHWKSFDRYVPGQEYRFIEVGTVSGKAVFLTPDQDPLGYVAGKTLLVAGIYVGRDWKGRRGQVMPWLRAQENPSGRKSIIPTDSEKTVPGVCMARIYHAMNPRVHTGFAS
jgi:hypothetical protein